MLLETHGLFPTNLSATSRRIERKLIKSHHFVDAIKREVNNYGTKRTTLPRLRQLEDAISLTDQPGLRYSIGTLKDRSRIEFSCNHPALHFRLLNEYNGTQSAAA